MNTKQNHCPKGCQTSDLDDMGYCKHLAGFTNDGKVMEPLVKVDRTTSEKKGRHGYLAGEWTVDGAKREQVRKEDVLVNPERDTIDNGAVVRTKAWVSARVYRDLSDDELDKLTRPELAAV